MTGLDPGRYLAHLREESARFRDVLAACDPTARVPSCPDWDADDLLWHLARVQWFWAEVIENRPAAPSETERDRPEERTALLALFDDVSQRLLDALAAADPTQSAWSWWVDQTVGFTFRRQAHEALIHRLDAELTAGVVTPLDPALAADGVHEALEVMYGGTPPSWASFTPVGGLVRIDLTDVATSYWACPGSIEGTDPDSGRVLSGPHLLVVEDPGTDSAAILSGTAEDVDAWLWHRRAENVLTATGDQGVADAFRAAVAPSLD